jgi:hypothetical protein
MSLFMKGEILGESVFLYVCIEGNCVIPGMKVLLILNGKEFRI